MATAEHRATGRLASRIPVPRIGVEALERRRAGARWVLRSADGTGFAEIDEQELALWRLLDGKRSVGELALNAVTWPRPASLDWIGASLSKFARGHLLAGDWPGEELGHSRLLVRFGGPFSMAGFERLAGRLGTLLFAVFGCLGLIVSLLHLFATSELSLMPFGAGPWSLVGCVFLALTWVEGARALGYMSLSRPLEAVGIGRSWGLPVLTFEVPVLSPVEHRRPAMWGLGSLFLLGGAAALLASAPGGSPAWDQLFTVVLVLLVLDLGPVFEGDGHLLMVVWTRDRDIRHRALAFVGKRFIPKLLARESFEPEEHRLAAIGAGMTLWAVVALNAGTRVFKASLGGFSTAMGSTASLPAMLASGVILAAGIGVLLWGLVSLLLVPARVLVSSGLRGEPVARLMLPLAAIASLVAVVPFPGIAGSGYVLFTFVALGLLYQQVRAIPGARLGRGYFYLWCGLLAHFLANAPRVLAAMGAFELGYVPGAYFGVLDLVLPFGLCAFGVLATLEAIRSRPTPGSAISAALLVSIGCAFAPLAPSWTASGLAVLIGVAPAAALLICLERWNTPMRNFWRPFVLAVILLAAAGWLERGAEPGIGASLRCFIAGMAMLTGALLAARAMFGVGLPVGARPTAQRMAPSATEALWDGGSHLLESVVSIAAFFLGEARASRIVEEFNAALSGHPSLPLAFEGGRLRLPPGAQPALDVLAASLYSGLRFLKGEIVSSAGANFFDRSVAASAEALYWSEWEQVHQHLLTGGDRRAAQARLREELGRVPLFRNLSAAQLEDMVGVLQHHHFSPGDVLIRQGEPGYRFYVVSRGKLSVTREDRMGFQQRLATLGPRDCFGETALLEGGIRTATVAAETEGEVISLNKEGFERFLPDREQVTSLIRHGSFLLRIPLFSGLPSTVLSELASRLTVKEHARGAVVAPARHQLEELLLVKEGTLACGVKSAGPGEAFGQMALVGPLVGDSPITAPGGATVLHLPVAAIVESLRDWLDGFSTLDELARGHGAASWQM